MIVIGSILILQSTGLRIIPSLYKFTLNVSGELLDINYYASTDREKMNVTPIECFTEPDKWGCMFNETEVDNIIRESGRKFDKKIYYEITSSKNYERSFIPYMLERNLAGQFKNITNQIGQREERQLKRFIDFSPSGDFGIV